jgi:hypothetical protein
MLRIKYNSEMIFALLEPWTLFKLPFQQYCSVLDGCSAGGDMIVSVCIAAYNDELFNTWLIVYNI